MSSRTAAGGREVSGRLIVERLCCWAGSGLARSRFETTKPEARTDNPSRKRGAL